MAWDAPAHMTTATTESARGRRKLRVGKVVSDRMDKTIVVSIERLVKHADYGRYVRRREKFKVHDEKNECRIGDVVRFMETRPMSKDKRWRFVEVIERAK
jgi:small subunit ribosomal protein S17